MIPPGWGRERAYAGLTRFPSGSRAVRLPSPFVDESPGRGLRSRAGEGLDRRGPSTGLGERDLRRIDCGEAQAIGTKIPDGQSGIRVDEIVGSSVDRVGTGEGLDGSSAAVGNVDFDRNILSPLLDVEHGREMMRTRLTDEEGLTHRPGFLELQLLIGRADDPRGVVAVRVSFHGPGENSRFRLVAKIDLETMIPPIAGPSEDQAKPPGHDQPSVSVVDEFGHRALLECGYESRGFTRECL